VYAPAKPEDCDAVRQVAKQAFVGYFDHYHADPRLQERDADEAYADWAARLCQDPAATVILARDAERVLGFGSMRLDENEGHAILFAVDPQAQGRGLLFGLVRQALSWCCDHGARRMAYVTHLQNVRAQRTLMRHKFVPVSSQYTFHKWYS
jgi:GNAT superfamily N-acetyltransferase